MPAIALGQLDRRLTDKRVAREHRALKWAEVGRHQERRPGDVTLEGCCSELETNGPTHLAERPRRITTSADAG